MIVTQGKGKYGSRITVMIPALELDNEGRPVGIRSTVHCHRGDYGVEDPWSGAVQPALPELLDTTVAPLQSMHLDHDFLLSLPVGQTEYLTLIGPYTDVWVPVVPLVDLSAEPPAVGRRSRIRKSRG